MAVSVTRAQRARESTGEKWKLLWIIFSQMLHNFAVHLQYLIKIFHKRKICFYIFWTHYLADFFSQMHCILISFIASVGLIISQSTDWVSYKTSSAFLTMHNRSKVHLNSVCFLCYNKDGLLVIGSHTPASEGNSHKVLDAGPYLYLTP